MHACRYVKDLGWLCGILVLKIVVWSGYPAIYFLAEGGVITCKQQHELYLINDVVTKFSYTIIISAGSLRCIEMIDARRRKSLYSWVIGYE